jgi:hypothetical protein
MLKKLYFRLNFLFIALIVSSIIFASVPSGYYYFAKNKKKAALKTALCTYCAPMNELDYGGGPGFTWEGFFYTDQKADGSVFDMYSNTVRKFNGFAAVDGMHIEHSFPKSWWGAHPNNAYKDLFHLYPADAVTNMTKSNLPLGEVTGTPSLDNGVTKIGQNGFGTSYIDNCFEPADEYKGDFARSYFYISTIYETYSQLWQSPMLNNNTYPVWKPWALDLLLKWHRQDPVSAKELARAESIYTIQGNRNPFIDYPNLAENIWGKDTSNVFPFPVETQPFLLSPRRGATIDFGVILSSDSRTKNLHILGVNINDNVQISLAQNNPALLLSTKTISIDNTLNGFDLAISFTPQTSGPVRDTLLIQGGGMTESLRIPIKALASAEFITLEPTAVKPIGGTLQWISDPQATDYKLNVYQGDIQTGDLFISTYIEGNSWNKAIELYNGTGKTIDLSNYSLQKQSNGSGSFGSTLKLSGTLANNKTFVIAHKQSTTDLLSKAQFVTDSVLQYNGNDAVALMRNGVAIDMAGQANAGADINWGLDVTLQRKSSVTHPISTFNATEWTTLPIDTWTMLGNHPIILSTSSNYILNNISTGKTTSYAIENLSPSSIYTYKIEAIKPNGNSTAINTMQIHTSALDVPILMRATGVQSKSFTANWEETLFAAGYLLNVFEVNGKADTTETEGFKDVGTNGKPLPMGWSGTASANYSSPTSSGVEIPSVNLKLGEWLQTKTYPQAVSNFTFMYRFASTSTGSAVVVEGLANNNWVKIDSIIYKNIVKTNPVYAIDKSQNMRDFRFRFIKVGSGNLAIDDVAATYGNQTSIFALKDKAVSTTYFNVENLKENSLYFYNVRATFGSSVSNSSESVEVKTLLNNKLSTNKTSTIRIHTSRNSILINSLIGNEQISIYSLTGNCLTQCKSFSSTMEIPFHANGIIIVKVQDNQTVSTFKICKNY